MLDNTIDKVLGELKSQQFYGSVELKYEGGRIVLLRKTETIKPASEGYRDNRGIRNARD